MFATETGYYNRKDIKPCGLPLDNKLSVAVKATSIPWNTWRPDRIWVENGHAKLESIDAMKAFMKPFVEGTIFAQVVDTLEWPLDAVFKLTHRVKAWPTGYETYERFFPNKEELKTYLASQREWATLEDNYFDVVSIEHWDLGPNLIKESEIDSL